MKTTPAPSTDRPPVRLAPRSTPPAAVALPDLTAAAHAIASGARLSATPSGELVTRAPKGMRSGEALRFIADARRMLGPVTGSADTRAALLRILAPQPLGWGADYGCALVALLWSDALARLPSPLALRRGHAATDAARFVDSLRAAILPGPARTDSYGVQRWEPRLYTGALAADLNDLDRAVGAASTSAAGAAAATSSTPRP